MGGHQAVARWLAAVVLCGMLARAEEIPVCRVACPALGHVFLTSEPVSFSVTTQVARVRWSVTDFWRQPVARGEAVTSGGVATILPPAGLGGYFLLHLEADRDGKASAESYTSFAVIPPYTVPERRDSPFGVMTHFAQGMSPEILPLFAKAGIVSIRDEHYWGQVEKSRGVYAFSERSDAYMAACKQAGIDPLVAMTFGNALYDNKDGPTTPEGFAAYGDYGQAILRHYGDQIRWLEIWNEYNGSWAPPSAKKTLESRYTTYTAMLKAAYAKIKAVRPDVQVLGGACVLIPIPYLEGIFKQGGLDAMDAVVIHPYRPQPEGVDTELQELKALIRTYNGGKDKPIWVTENGRHSKEEADWEKGRGFYELGRQEGARYLPRMYTLLLSEGVSKIYWYLGSDYKDFVTMGLVRRLEDPMGPYAVAAPFVTYATLIRQLDGAVFVAREAKREYTRARVYHFCRGGEDIRVCWATQPSKIRVTAKGPLTRVSLVGGETALPPVADGTVLDLTEDVFYLRGAVDAVEEVDTDVRILADAADDYTKTQGGNNWYYGYFDGSGEGFGDGRAPTGPYTDDDFKEMKPVETMWGVNWGGPAAFLSASRGNLHPGMKGKSKLCAVVRWKSPVAGKVRLVGGFTRSDAKGDGVEGRVLLDGAPVFERPVGGASRAADFDVEVTVAVGSLIDVVVDPGKDTAYDSTGYRLRVIQEK